MTLFSLAFSLFLLMDAIGNIPLFISFLKDLDPERQRKVIFRELIIALGIIILFAVIGNGLMGFLQININTIQIAGGLILFLLSLKMVFPQNPHEKTEESIEEPFIVPLAVPLVAGPGVLAAVMIYARQAEYFFILIGAILLAWLASLGILLTAPIIKNAFGPRGLIALERLMGLLLTLIAVQMFLSGFASFVNNIQQQ